MLCDGDYCYHDPGWWNILSPQLSSACSHPQSPCLTEQPPLELVQLLPEPLSLTAPTEPHLPPNTTVAVRAVSAAVHRDATENSPCPSLPISLSLTNATVPAGHHGIRSAPPPPPPHPVSHRIQEREVGGPEAEGGNCLCFCWDWWEGKYDNFSHMPWEREREREVFIPSCPSFMLEFNLYQECHFLLWS